MKGSAMAASAVASAGLTVAVGRSVAVGATMVGTGRGVAEAVGVGVGVIVGAGRGVAVGAGVGVGRSCVGVGGVVRRGGTVGVAGMGVAASRRDPHPLRTIRAMLAPSASNPCRVSHPGVPRTVYPGAQRLKEQRPAP